MKSRFAFSIFTLVGVSCASAPPAPGTDAVPEAATSIAVGEVPAGSESGGIDPIGIELPLLAEPASQLPTSEAGLPSDSGNTVTETAASTAAIGDAEADRLFHPAEIDSVPSPVPAEPLDPTQPESVAAFVVAVWFNEPEVVGSSEAVSDWITPRLATEMRSAAPTAVTSSVRSTVVGTELAGSDFETLVLVTVERFDPRTGEFSVSAVEVLLVLALNSWAVAALEFAR